MPAMLPLPGGVAIAAMVSYMPGISILKIVQPETRLWISRPQKLKSHRKRGSSFSFCGISFLRAMLLFA